MPQSYRIVYLLSALGLFLIELTIALYVHDRFVRPFVGDTLVVVLLYCGLQAATLQPPERAARQVLGFAYAIECLQAVDFAAWFGADRVPWLSVALGRTFSWEDLGAYTVGYLLCRLDPARRRSGIPAPTTAEE